MLLFAFLGGYIFTSLFLLKYPTLIHKKKRIKFRPKHISHRGGAAENLENTMAAFKHAEMLGTDMFELDCQLTRDGQVVVSHDNLLLRTCNEAVKISDVNFEDLPQMKKKLRVDFYQSMIGEGDDRQIPLLQDVFKTFPKMPINIDIKENNDILIEKVNSLIVEYNRIDLTAWGNRSDVVCNKLYIVNPNVPLFFSFRQVIKLMVLFWTGLLPFVPIRESLLEVVIPGLMLSADEIFHRHLGGPSRCFFWLMDKLLMRPALISHLDKRGIQTYLWVLNREEDFERALSLGATGIMTDRVSLLKTFLDRQHQSSSNACSPDPARE